MKQKKEGKRDRKCGGEYKKIWRADVDLPRFCRTRIYLLSGEPRFEIGERGQRDSRSDHWSSDVPGRYARNTRP
jgi:hypothetical protein